MRNIANLLIAIVAWLPIGFFLLVAINGKFDFGLPITREMAIGLAVIIVSFNIYSIFHVVNSKTLSNSGKFYWVVFLLLFSILTQPNYWYAHMDKPKFL